VGWSDFVRRRSPRVKRTALEVAAALVETIVLNTNALQARLGAEGFVWTDPDRTATDECLLECVLFEWFLVDVAMSAEFGSRAEAVRRALPGRLLVDLQRSGLAAAALEGLHGRCGERFAEYAEALEISASLQPLGALAWRRISGRDEPSERMTMLLAIRASAELMLLRDAARNLVDPPRAQPVTSLEQGGPGYRG
jgi:hypothetical protein